MTTKTNKRMVDGVLLLDKPLAMSSNFALQKVKRLFKAKKAGHTGSLDPLATGVLPICFGKATKLSTQLLAANKHYDVTAKLGEATETGDAEGAVVAKKTVPVLSKADIETVTKTFLGSTQQVPSMYSALKHNGQPLYKLARQGITVDRPSREIFISDYTLLEQTKDTLRFSVRCSKGTYIRTLMEDLGNLLGCGAHVIQLRRVGVGHFNIDQTYTLSHLAQLSQQSVNEDFSALDALLLTEFSQIVQCGLLRYASQ